MKKKIHWLLSIVLTALALGAHAQTIWTYEIIGSDNQPRITYSPPRDISYPAANVATPIYFANEGQQGVPLTAREETLRANAPMLIILLGPDTASTQSTNGSQWLYK